MARAYARLETKSAKIASDFGRDWATNVFGAEAIDSLPKFEHGPNKGKPKGFIIWRKAISSGWCSECQTPLAVGNLADAWIGLGQFTPRGAAMIGQWLGRVQTLVGSKYHLFQEGRDRWAAEMARKAEDDLAELAEWYHAASDEQQARCAAKVNPEKLALIQAYIAEHCGGAK